MDNPVTHGGAGRGQGRPSLPDDLRTVVVSVRLTPARRDKLRSLGSSWLSSVLDSVDDPLSASEKRT